MATDPSPSIWLQAGGTLAAMLAAFGGAFRWVSARFQRHEDRFDALTRELRTERHDGDQRLWAAINMANVESAKHRAAVATRDELRDMFRDHERRMQQFLRATRASNQEGN